MTFNLEAVNEAECFAEYRCQKTDIKCWYKIWYKNGDMLGLPSRFVCYQGTGCDCIAGLCIALKRLAYPGRCSDLIYLIEKRASVLNTINNKVIDFIYMGHGHRITQWNNTILNPRSIQIHADAILGKGRALPNCFGFIDGTIRLMCRPKVVQRTVYNGHKWVHALKFQSVTLPNSTIAHMGPWARKFIMPLLRLFSINLTFPLTYLVKLSKNYFISYKRFKTLSLFYFNRFVKLACNSCILFHVLSFHLIFNFLSSLFLSFPFRYCHNFTS